MYSVEKRLITYIQKFTENSFCLPFCTYAPNNTDTSTSLTLHFYAMLYCYVSISPMRCWPGFQDPIVY